MKPIARILVLDGPTHYGLPLPVAGKTDFHPRTKVPIYHTADLIAAERMLPSGQVKVRVFPRIEDAPEAPRPQAAPQDEAPAKKARKK